MMNIIEFVIIKMIDALFDGSVEEVRANNRALRVEGLFAPTTNTRIVDIDRHAPLIENEGLTHLTKFNDWVRDSLATFEVKAIAWETGLRVLCSRCNENGVESWLPRNAACRECGSWYSEFNATLRDRISTTYEAQVEMLGIRLYPKVRGVRSWMDGRYCILKPTMRKGMLRNGNNAEGWFYSGLTAGKVAYALHRLGLKEESEAHYAMNPSKQIWREVCFFDYVHRSDRSKVREGCLDIALSDSLTSQGYKVRSSPRRTLD
jgi:hypothetical protein